MVSQVNPDNSINPRIETTSQSAQRMSPKQDRQATDTTAAHSRETEGAQVDVDNARQRYQMENHRASGASRITTPDQAGDLLGRILQQFTASPAQSLQAQTSPGPAALSNLLGRAPV
jgi:hypothetical protein